MGVVHVLKIALLAVVKYVYPHLYTGTRGVRMQNVSELSTNSIIIEYI